MSADSTSAEPDHTSSLFATTFRAAVQQSRLSLRAIRQRLIERGYDISVSTLSLWQCNARRPERTASIDIIRELETILGLDVGELTDSLGPSRRLGSIGQAAYAPLAMLPAPGLARGAEPELLERSGAVGVYVDTESRITRTVNTTLWQARRDGARTATVFSGLGGHDVAGPELIGTIGCDLVDAVMDREHDVVRATLQLHVPLRQGELVMTERQTIEPPDAEPTDEISIVAPRRQAEFVLYVVFDPDARPRRCRVIVDTLTETRSHTVPLNGDCVTHAEFGFGPGSVTLQWDW